MSLLSTQERWGVTCGHGEEFDKGSLATLGPTSQFDDSRTIVFSASTSGVVRAYNPEAKGYDENDLMVETDSPYLAPAPLRGKSNEPSFIIHTVKFLSELKKMSFEDFSNITTKNFLRLFGELN